MDTSPLKLLSAPVQLAILAGGAALFSIALVHSAGEIPQHFTDIAGKSRFSYKTNNDFRDRKYLAATMCGGVAAFDFDGDGWIDLYFTNGARIPEMRKTSPEFDHCLLRNRHDGTFEDVTRKAGLEGNNLGYAFGVAAGDYDNDGHPDLFIATAGRDALFHNNGNGTFADVTASSGLDTKPPDTMSMDAVWFDYDNDGLLDLAVSEYTLWRPETEFHCMGPGDIGEAYCHPKRYKSVPNRLYHNLGGGKFEDVTERSGFAKSLGKGMGIVVADFNRDGLMDVFVSNDTERNFLYLNKGDGKFEEVGLLWGVAYNEDGAMISGMGADAKDYDNDGWPDIFYNDLNSQIFGLFQNDRGRSFRDLSVQSGVARLSRRFSGWSNGFIDYDNDGWKDIYSSNGDVDYIGSNSKQHDTMWRNLGGRSFEDVSEKMGPDFLPLGYHKGSAFADLNNDGFMDLVVTALNERPRILINSGNLNHWLLLDLQGTESNRDAMGAQVKVITGSGRTLYNHVTTSVGFMSSSERRVHFGLGAEEKIASIEIQWPGGKLQKLGETATNQILRVQEPR